MFVEETFLLVNIGLLAVSNTAQLSVHCKQPAVMTSRLVATAPLTKALGNQGGVPRRIPKLFLF